MNSGFNLCRDPWIMVLDERQIRHEVSLIDAIRDSRQWHGLAGEMPTQDVAILRLILAILYRALRHDFYDDEAIDEWAGWWRDGLPVDRVVNYLAEHVDRFELLSEKVPFMQVADLHTASGSTSGLSKLIAEIPDGFQFFTTRAGRGLESIGDAEAARWLVHAQAFDPSGIKSGAVGDSRVKSGKGYPIGTGWCGNLGIVVPEGRTLAETLLLNLVHDAPSPDGDTAFWEREPLTAAEDPGLATRPAGPVGLLTWQSRRLRLLRDGSGRVVDALVCNGDRIGAQNRYKQEAWSAWRRSQNQEKKGDHGSIVYMPVQHLPDRAVWRGLGGMLAGAGSSRGTAQDAPRLLPPVLDWLDRLTNSRALDPDHPVRFRVVAAGYGPQSSTIAAVTEDAMNLHMAVLTDSDLKATVVSAIEATDKAVFAVRALAGNLASASGALTDGPRERAAEQAWHILDRPFRAWAARLTAETDVQQELTVWHRTAASLLRKLADELVESAGDKAWKGRHVASTAGKSSHLDSSLAHLWFLNALGSALDRARPAQTEAPPRAADGWLELPDMNEEGTSIEEPV